MKKVAVDIGHNCSPDIGASGLLIEDNLTKAVGDALIEKLSKSYEVVNTKPTKAKSVSDSLACRCAIANSFDADYFISIHFNAFDSKANGAEVYAISDRGKQIATSVLNQICKLGYYNRGVKDGSHLYVLKHTNMPAILIEGCFIDCQKDIDILGDVKQGTESIAEAIYQGIQSLE